MKYVFISPHIDDALLSVGGLIINLINEKKQVNIKYIFTISNWTNPEAITEKTYVSDPVIISKIRKSEEMGISLVLKYEYDFLDYLDNPLRRELRKEEQELMIYKLRKQLEQLINKNDCYFFPLGLDHPDHILVREMGIDFLKKGFNILFYEDMPYLTSGKYDKREFYNAITKMGLVPEETFIDFEMKRSLLFKYESQVSHSWIKDMMNYSYNIERNSYVERWWKPVHGKEI